MRGNNYQPSKKNTIGSLLYSTIHKVFLRAFYSILQLDFILHKIIIKALFRQRGYKYMINTRVNFIYNYSGNSNKSADFFRKANRLTKIIYKKQKPRINTKFLMQLEKFFCVYPRFRSAEITTNIPVTTGIHY